MAIVVNDDDDDDDDDSKEDDDYNDHVLVNLLNKTRAEDVAP